MYFVMECITTSAPNSNGRYMLLNNCHIYYWHTNTQQNYAIIGRRNAS